MSTWLVLTTYLSWKPVKYSCLVFLGQVDLVESITLQVRLQLMNSNLKLWACGHLFYQRNFPLWLLTSVKEALCSAMLWHYHTVLSGHWLYKEGSSAIWGVLFLILLAVLTTSSWGNQFSCKWPAFAIGSLASK